MVKDKKKKMKIKKSIKKWGQNVEYRINSKNRSRI